MTVRQTPENTGPETSDPKKGSSKQAGSPQSNAIKVRSRANITSEDALKSIAVLRDALPYFAEQARNNGLREIGQLLDVTMVAVEQAQVKHQRRRQTDAS